MGKELDSLRATIDDQHVYDNNSTGTHPRSPRRRKRFLSYPRYVELMVTADAKMVRHHGRNLEHYILTIMSVVSKIMFLKILILAQCWRFFWCYSDALVWVLGCVTCIFMHTLFICTQITTYFSIYLYWYLAMQIVVVSVQDLRYPSLRFLPHFKTLNTTESDTAKLMLEAWCHNDYWQASWLTVEVTANTPVNRPVLESLFKRFILKHVFSGVVYTLAEEGWIKAANKLKKLPLFSPLKLSVPRSSGLFTTMSSRFRVHHYEPDMKDVLDCRHEI